MCVEQIIDVLHPNRGSVPKEELKEKLAKTYKVGVDAYAPSCGLGSKPPAVLVGRQMLCKG